MRLVCWYRIDCGNKTRVTDPSVVAVVVVVVVVAVYQFVPQLILEAGLICFISEIFVIELERRKW